MTTASDGGIVRLAGLLAATVIFTVIQPLLLVGVPLAVLLAAYGPRDARSAVLILGVAAFVALGERSGIWWFERAWPLVLGGSFVWVVAWRREWSFSAQALAALSLAFVMTGGLMALAPRIWLELDATMTTRALTAARTAGGLLGSLGNGQFEDVVRGAAELQARLFPALLGLSSMAALGVAAWVRGWLEDDERVVVGALRNFRFHDQLIWVWLAGLVLLVAPLGDLGARVGGNAVFFMGLLYVLRGVAIALALVGSIPVALGVIGGLTVLILSPLLALLLAGALLLGLGDTWLDLRGRLARR